MGTAQTQEVQEDYIGSLPYPLEGWKALQKWVSPENVVDMKQFKETMTLRDALSLCGEQMSKNKRGWIFVLDVAAFKIELPESKRDLL